jgi:type I restriction enzyme M protein
MDLIPPTLIVARYFADEQAELDELNAEMERAAQVVEEFVEENSGEDGLLADAINDGKISKSLVNARLGEARREDPRSDEVVSLLALIELYDAEAMAKKSAKEMGAKLDATTLAQYASLSTADIQELVIIEKWGTSTASRIRFEVEGSIQRLIERIAELGGRYDSTLESLESDVAELNTKVNAHLAVMGVS